MSESHQEFNIVASHPVGFFREDVNDQLFVLYFPASVFWMRDNDRLDIIFNVFLLSFLVMKGNVEGI